MTTMVYKDFSFDSAHRLPNVPEGHKCARLHGHTYRVKVWCEGDIGKYDGWVLDYADIAAVVAPVIDELDHRYLNEIEGLPNPTCELIGAWMWDRIKPGLRELCRIEIAETCTAGCVVIGERADRRAS